MVGKEEVKETRESGRYVYLTDVPELKGVKIHPMNAVFPMMNDQELEDLTDSIKAWGLYMPIVFDKDGVLIDGKNRLVACWRAGVQPETITLPEGTDVRNYLSSEHFFRQEYTPSQVLAASVTAYKMALAEGAEKPEAGFEHAMERPEWAMAEMVYDYAPELVDRIIQGGIYSIGRAYSDVLSRRVANEVHALAQTAKDAVQGQIEGLPEHHMYVVDVNTLREAGIDQNIIEQVRTIVGEVRTRLEAAGSDGGQVRVP